VGKKISSADVDSVKEFLPENLYDTYKDSAKWGSHWFLIVPYQQITLPPGCIKFTKEYYGQPKIGSQGELINWISGYPFPDTTVGIEIAHNARCRTGGDAYISRQDGWTTDGRLKYDMASLIHSNYNYYAARWDTPPTPEILPNPKQIWRAFTLLQLDPPETRNMRIMEVQYKDQLKAYDSWMWLPTIRRVRRRSTSERQDPQGGSDYCSYDNSGWDGPVQINKYNYLGAKELLMPRHGGKSKIEHIKGDCLVNGTQRERVKIHIVEAVNADPNFLYSKMIWYVDPETWQIHYADRYDRHGKLWKIYEQMGDVEKGYQGVPVIHYNATQTIDVQRKHSTFGVNDTQYGVTHDLNKFDTDYLQKKGY
jgi:hypothetical protein